VAESCRGADSARGSRCAANTEWRSSPPTCQFCAVARPAPPQGSTAPAASTPHPLDRSDTRRPPADKSDGAPPSTSLFAITVSAVAVNHAIRLQHAFGSGSHVSSSGSSDFVIGTQQGLRHRKAARRACSARCFGKSSARRRQVHGAALSELAVRMGSNPYREPLPMNTDKRCRNGVAVPQGKQTSSLDADDHGMGPRVSGRRPSDAPPLRLLRRPNGLNYPSGLAVQPDYCEYFCGVEAEGSACPSRWCCGHVVARGTPRARGSSRQLLCRRLRTRDLFRRTASFRGSRRRCPDIARRLEFSAAALMTVSTRICSCCSPIRPAASTNCRARTATCRDRIARSNGGT
jgi:hypothetical protein